MVVRSQMNFLTSGMNPPGLKRGGRFGQLFKLLVRVLYISLRVYCLLERRGCYTAIPPFGGNTVNVQTLKSERLYYHSDWVKWIFVYSHVNYTYVIDFYIMLGKMFTRLPIFQ